MTHTPNTGNNASVNLFTGPLGNLRNVPAFEPKIVHHEINAAQAAAIEAATKMLAEIGNPARKPTHTRTAEGECSFAGGQASIVGCSSGARGLLADLFKKSPERTGHSL